MPEVVSRGEAAALCEVPPLGNWCGTGLATVREGLRPPKWAAGPLAAAKFTAGEHARCAPRGRVRQIGDRGTDSPQIGSRTKK
jgi:hypothetical protein